MAQLSCQETNPVDHMNLGEQHVCKVPSPFQSAALVMRQFITTCYYVCATGFSQPGFCCWQRLKGYKRTYPLGTQCNVPVYKYILKVKTGWEEYASEGKRNRSIQILFFPLDHVIRMFYFQVLQIHTVPSQSVPDDYHLPQFTPATGNLEPRSNTKDGDRVWRVSYRQCCVNRATAEVSKVL